ncbi:piggyBac transposable element-derived protein 4-like [Pseudochaenichthys georgianus]|uniref:piggyBac transposable element-derived protein 4-like n=1 Tax=Pseudochaenichthys georgianus TaxID=52239 RepID=UPI0039C1CBA3
MDKRKRLMNVQEALALLNRMSEAESDGGEVSGLSDVSWVCSASDGSSDSDPEPPRNVRLSHHDPPLADEPTVPAHAEVCATEPSPAQEIGKDGTVWTVMEPCGGAGRRQIQNILTESAGPTPHARHTITDKLTAFMCLCDSVMLEEIRDCTIAEARRDRATWDVSIMELKAFIALLYVRGAYCGKNIEMESFWSEQWGNAFFNATLSRNRFREIMRYLRFDKKETRRCRLTTDKFTHVRKVWDRFVDNSIASYRPGSDITVDEQLFLTKSRCPFTQYMPNKPDKFGIKFWLAADVDSKYMLNGFPYLGKDASRPATQRLGENVVLRLVEPFVGKGRNITTDNFFTSLPLAKALLAKNTSLVGTIKRNKRELPPSVQGRSELFSTKVLKSEKMVLSVYQCKPRRNVTILSTQHQHVAISTERKRKPETVEYYNHSKVGVDVLDQMARQYSVKGGTRRWPVAVFYNVLDLAGSRLDQKRHHWRTCPSAVLVQKSAGE